MKKTAIILLLIFGCTLYSGAATNLSPRQQEEVVAKINAAASKMSSMSCTYTQTKHLSLLSEKMVSEGKMWYRQPNKLRWEYTSPYNYLFVLNGTKVYVGNKSRKDVIDTSRNKVFQEIARIMMNTVTGKALSDRTDFSTSVAANGTSWIITLIPKKKEMRQMFAKIDLVFNKADTMISEIDIYEKNNDRTNIKLNNIVSNGTISESYFTVP